MRAIKTMASRFVGVAHNDVIEELKTSSENLNTIEKVQIYCHYWLEYLRNGQTEQQH
jgi:hypothetical protein